MTRAKTVKGLALTGQVVGYARVSTQDQNLDLQIEALKCAGCTRIYREKVSGAKAQRNELSKMLDFIREGDTVVVYKLDRLARSMKQLFDLVELFDEKGVGFKTLTGIEVDTTTNHGRLIFNIFGAIAEFERGLIRERTQAGRQRAIDAGVKMGRPGLDPKIKSTVRQRIRGGQTWSQIINELGVSRSSVARCARDMSDKATQPGNGRRKTAKA